MKQILLFTISIFIITSCGNDPDDEKVLDSIEITEEPTKKNYSVNDEFDAAGMVVTAVYSDNSTEPVLVTPDMLSYDFTTAGTEKTVTISYQDKTATVTGITVSEPLALSITSFTPAEAGHGTTVTITGTNFSATLSDNTVTFNNIASVVVSATETELKVTVPKNLECSGLIRVTRAGKTSVSPGNFTYKLIYTVSTFPGGTGLNASGGLFVDASGNVFVSDKGNHVIRKITPSGNVSTVAGIGEATHFADGPVESATFRYPEDIIMDGSGAIYVTSDQRIRKIAGGMVSTLAGGGSQGFEDGAGNSAKFSGPGGLALDASGNIYVADVGNHRIRKITAAGAVTTFAGSTHGFADGTGVTAQFEFPICLVFDATGNMYVSDQYNSCIRKITPAGVVTTFAGTPGFNGFADGTGSNAKFFYPQGLTIDAVGNLYVADRGNRRIRKITPAGVVTTVAGDGTIGITDGAGSVAQFTLPTYLSMDDAGNLYVSDSDNGRIRKIIAE